MHRRMMIYTGRLLTQQKPAICSNRNVHWDQPYPTDMYENPHVREHQRKRDENIPKDWHKQSTGICGLYVSVHPHEELIMLYTRIIRLLEMMPKDYIYRQNTEDIVLLRLSHIQKEQDIQKLEQIIGMGQIEEVIEQARHELESARAIVHFKCWEPLVEAADESQWRWPIGSGP